MSDLDYKDAFESYSILNDLQSFDSDCRNQTESHFKCGFDAGLAQQSARTQELEGAINKLINCKLDRFSNQVAKDQNINLAIENLRKLMEIKSE